jgi:hypothetical protein
MGKNVGAIPIFSKWRQNARIRKLHKRADGLKEKFCALSEDVDAEKDRASEIFTKKDYDKAVEKLDDVMSEATECAAGGGGGGDGGGITELKKDCGAEAAKKIGRESARGLKKGSPEHTKWLSFKRECIAKGGGSSV